jgi:hypothetical protein
LLDVELYQPRSQGFSGTVPHRAQILCLNFRPWAFGQNYFASWHPFGKYLVWGLFDRHIGTSLPKKVPKQKSCPIPRKWVINDYPLAIKLYYSKKWEILYSITIKMTSAYKTFKQFFDFSNSL